MTDVLGLGHRVSGGLRGLVGVEGALVVGVLARVELGAGQVEVELLEVDAEGGHVLERQLLHRRELGLLARELLALAGPVREPHDTEDPGEQEQDDTGFPCVSLRTRAWTYRVPGNGLRSTP